MTSLSLAVTVTVTAPPGTAELLCHTLVTSSENRYQQDGDMPARLPKTKHPPTNARPARARASRPASVTLSPGRNPGHRRTRLTAESPAAGRAHEDAHPAQRRTSSRNTPQACPVRGRP